MADVERLPVEELAEEFVARWRKGERPTAEEYARRHPEHAAEILDLFPALVLIEDLAPSSAGSESSLPAARPGAAAPPTRVGDYRILREVGHGGMGVVYEAEQTSLGRRVALKVLPPQLLRQGNFLERFQREAKAAARLHHSNIVPVFGVGECDGIHFYAMQFIRGEGLDRVLADVRRLRRQPGEAPSAVPADGSVARGLLTGKFQASTLAGPDASLPQPESPPGSSGLTVSGPESE